MSAHRAVEAGIAKLATALRLSGEAYLRSYDLLKIDRDEAINNLELAFETKLEAFHSLYDVSKSLFAYHDHPDTALVIGLRNAIHHRDHPLFRTLMARIFLDETVGRWRGAAFLIARHPSSLGDPVAMTHRLRLDDIDARLNPELASPYLDILNPKKAGSRFAVIDEGLGLADLRRVAASEGYPKDQIYLDVMPVFISAICRVFVALKAQGVAFKGFDAETYGPHFTTQVAIDLRRLEYQSKRIPIWLEDGLAEVQPDASPN